MDNLNTQQQDAISKAYNIVTNKKYQKEMREFAFNIILAFTLKPNEKTKLKIKCFYRREDPIIVEIHEHMPFTKYKSIKYGDRPYRIEIPREIEFRCYEYCMIENWLDRKRNIDAEGVHYMETNKENSNE